MKTCQESKKLDTKYDFEVERIQIKIGCTNCKHRDYKKIGYSYCCLHPKGYEPLCGGIACKYKNPIKGY